MSNSNDTDEDLEAETSVSAHQGDPDVFRVSVPDERAERQSPLAQEGQSNHAFLPSGEELTGF